MLTSITCTFRLSRCTSAGCDLVGRTDLGRWEEALRAADEAAGLCRELAAARPAAFRPDLARSLAVLANCLEASERLDDALAADMEAIAALAPHFLALPAAFTGLMWAIVSGYLPRCEKAERKPDEELLAPIAEAFQRMQGTEGAGDNQG